ncbi:MAG: PIG-L family deacetylase [Spirosomaceae bacterium]|jgi:LmbE family N-acetylglucosaminyl deacetylase|nr:PIG-L family deacetylase [Spirosomataceae bacterium]
MRKIALFSCFIFSLFVSLLHAQVKSVSSSEILLNLKKLNVVGSVMHIAAHPDDENNLLLAYMAKERLLQTQYFSLTRGDGGQNLIGSEQGEYIGLIRTQELQNARRIEGTEQLFTRAYDFGFSKTREETLKFWGESKILADVVYIIRKYQPDVIITRFPPDARAGHGHHNSSAFLAEAAYKLCGDPTQFPEQLQYVKPWKPKRLIWNTYSPGFQNNKPGDKGSYIPLDMSGFNPYLGKSYTEIAAEARSMHKTQGFGAAPNRTTRIDYLLHKDGVPARKDPFDDIDLTWGRVPNSARVAQLIDQAIRNYNINFPASSVPTLVAVHKELNKMDADNLYVRAKKSEVETLIQQCLGLWFETNPIDYAVVAGDQAAVKLNVVKRAEFPVKLTKIQFQGAAFDTTLNVNLTTFEAFALNLTRPTSKNLKITQPFWLAKPIKDRVFQIEAPHQVGPAENTPELQTSFTFLIEGQEFTFTKPWVHKYTEPSDGEIYRPFEVRPEVTTNVAEQVYVFADNQPKNVDLVAKANRANVSGTLRVEVPAGWRVEPAQLPFSFKDKYQEQRFTVKVFPSVQSSEGKIHLVAETANGSTSHGLRTIEFKHILAQTVFPPAEANLVKLDIKNKATKIGYIAGAGDEVPAALRQMGCQVTLLDETELNKNLGIYDAIVVGVRAYNTEDRIGFFQNKLMEYVKNGGTMVVQYATLGFSTNSLKVKEIGPYPFKISRDRVTDEEAKMTFLAPAHPLLNTPNKITDADFDKWVQERGIYFAVDFDKAYTPLFSCGDPGEAEKNGSLIYCQYGKGHFMYTGLAFFRELPAGVPGAYRLFANMISLSKK